jgi:hypothetical protein
VQGFASGFLPTPPHDDAVASGSELAPPLPPGDFHPQSVAHAGRTQEWAQPNLDRLQRTVFVIYPDASFEMREPDGYTPMRGTISADGTFSVSSSFNSGVGYASAEVMGQISVQNGVPVVSLTYTSSSAAGANVNNTSYGYSNGKAYQATATLQQVS